MGKEGANLSIRPNPTDSDYSAETFDASIAFRIFR